MAKTVLISGKAQKKKFHIGYSDKIKVYLNSKEVFMGDNRFHDSGKRIDRGYVTDKHSTIELPLQEGENELILELAEDKFGWGFIAQLDNLEGIEIVDAK
jgi:hypothetical protein